MNKVFITALLRSVPFVFLVSIAGTFSSTTKAGSSWLKPGEFTLGMSDRALWVDFDMAHADYVFDSGRAFKASSVWITSPKGLSSEPASLFYGRRKASFEFEFSDSGTYKIEAISGPALHSRRPASKAPVTSKPASSVSKASKKEAAPKRKSRPPTKFFNRLTTYITINGPTDSVIGSDGVLLEVLPLTHPADIVEGEIATFKVLYDGLPLADVEVSLLQSGGRYSNRSLETKYSTDSKGDISLKPGSAGVYALKIRYQKDLLDDPQAKVLRATAVLTFEAQQN